MISAGTGNAGNGKQDRETDRKEILNMAYMKPDPTLDLNTTEGRREQLLHLLRLLAYLPVGIGIRKGAQIMDGSQFRQSVFQMDIIPGKILADDPVDIVFWP